MDLQPYQQVIRSISTLLPQETSIALADQSQYILYRPSGAIDLKIAPGDLLKQGSIAHQTLREGNKVAHFISPDLFGVPYYGLGTPLYDEKERLIGAITLIVPPERSHLLPVPPRTEYVIGQTENRFVPVHERDIAYFSSRDGTTLMHTRSSVYKIKQTLQALEWSLPGNQFLRCHRAFLVNIAWIQEIQRNFHSTFLLVMKDDAQTRISVSQKYASLFRTKLGF
ncbi:LytTR family DNA-binding domain-containing protein [Tumebacillus lipolyticus]|uniref:LytTR family DNA-binding domain-containing protein n=1 Tax=Tumebacillus lipolyticus TaxID=1280370 RepID=A0ABW5A027_9BACL